MKRKHQVFYTCEPTETRYWFREPRSGIISNQKSFHTKSTMTRFMRGFGGNFIVGKWIYRRGVRYYREYDFFSGKPVNEQHKNCYRMY